MAISFVGQAAAAATSVALPAHQPGDLIVIWAYQGTSNANTIALASGYTATAGQSGIGANSQSSRTAYKIATSSSELSGEWTNAEEVIAHVYRGVDQTTPIGGTSSMTGVADVTFPAITLAISDGSSWIAAFAGWRTSSANLGTAAFPGLTQRTNINLGTVSRSTTFDTATGVASFPVTSSSGATGFRYRTVAIEIRAAADATPQPAPPIFGTGDASFSQMTGTGSGNVFIAGAGNGNFEGMTGSAEARVLISGRASATFAAMTGNSSGLALLRGQGGGLFAAMTGVAEAKTVIAGSGSAAFAEMTGASEASVIALGAINGVANGNFSAMTSSATGCLKITGKGSGLFEAMTGGATGIEPIIVEISVIKQTLEAPVIHRSLAISFFSRTLLASTIKRRIEG